MTFNIIRHLHSAAISPTDTPQFYLRWALFLVPFSCLLVCCYLYLKRTIENQRMFSIDSTFSRFQYKLIYYSLILIIGTIGVLSALNNPWSLNAWLLYAGSTFTLALFIFLLRLGSRGQIFVNAIIGVFLIVILEFLVLQTLKNDSNDWTAVTIFLIAVAQIYCMNLTLIKFAEGFTLNSEYQLNAFAPSYGKGCNISPFVVIAIISLALTVALALFNRSKGCTMFEQCGYWAGQASLILMLISRKTGICD